MKVIHWIQNHLPTRRRLIQIYAALLYNANLKGYISGEIFTGNTKAVCVPGLNCYSCPGAVGACPLGALQNALAASGNRAPYYMLGIILLLGLTLGRTICGYLCPVGLIQELLHKLPTPKLKKSRVTRVLSYLKYVILAVFVVIIPLWYVSQHYPVPAFCKYICPAGTFEGAIAGKPRQFRQVLHAEHPLYPEVCDYGADFRRQRVHLPGVLPVPVSPGRHLRSFRQGEPGGREGGAAQVYPLRPVRQPLPDGHPPCGRP